MYECVGGGRGGTRVERGKGSVNKHFGGSFLEGAFQLGDSSVLEHLHLIYMQGRGDPRMVFTSTEHCFDTDFSVCQSISLFLWNLSRSLHLPSYLFHVCVT